VLALLRAIFLTAYREIRTLNSIQGNNFFWFALLLSLQPESMGFIWTLLGAIMMLPALAAPLARIPAIRLKFWPLTALQLRLLTPFVRPDAHASPWLWKVLPFLELRQILRTLDFWLAFLLAASGTAYRFLYPSPQPEAYPVISMMVVLALSTLAQNLFALDGLGGRLRWRLSPVRGYQILWRKGGALLLITVVLTLGLSPVGALAGMLAALAVGHHFSVFSPLDAGAWRFTMGQFFPYGFLQVIAMFSCGIAAGRGDLFYLGLASIVWLVSSLGYGWALEQAPLGNV
jgi:hypothetical protein